MHKLPSLIIVLAYSLALTSCVSPPARYAPLPRAEIPPLPADLSEIKDQSLCLHLLAIFSASPEMSRKVCDGKTP